MHAASLGTLRNPACSCAEPHPRPYVAALPWCSTRWGSDPLFRGSYSYLGPTATPADVAALAAPACAAGSDGSGSGGPPALLFAGEACHLKYIGTMQGAYLTGQQQAEALLARWQPAAAQPDGKDSLLNPRG